MGNYLLKLRHFSEVPMLLDVIHVEVQKNHRMLLEFANHEKRVFNMLPYLNIGVFKSLQDERLFRAAYISGGTVAWPGELDIAPETLYIESVPVSP
ncbi:MAG: DUF2442 domain-containing protein [Magnetococcales bacterium]|nr:DUF2442 domain-containing protein [Magnetococcales bacterium]NGZ25264.1 DUF2442 domain-containing protein [Magnetococcales bacterium]